MPEQEFADARRRMVEEQIRARGISDARLLAALQHVPRHRFVNPEYLPEAYRDYPLPIASGQTISQPYIVALMTELLSLTGAERVLEVGTGSGYQAAILAELCCEVVSIERYPELITHAQPLLTELGYHNVTLIDGDGSCGYAPSAPYDAILVTAASPKIAAPWLAQLAEGGRLVLPLGGRFGQVLTRMTKHEGKLREEDFGAVAFVPLIGENGWSGHEK